VYNPEHSTVKAAFLRELYNVFPRTSGYHTACASGDAQAVPQAVLRRELLNMVLSRRTRECHSQNQFLRS